MVNEDSPILDFYPEDFDIDMNGKKMAWQGIALLPFIEQNRLLGAIATVEPLLTDDEKRRNTTGDNVMLISGDNDLHPKFCEVYTKKKITKPVPIDGKVSRGICGSILPDNNFIPGATLDSPLEDTEECPDIEDNRSLSVKYYFPKMLFTHKSKLLPGVKMPRTILNEHDREQTRTGRRGGHSDRGGRGRGGYHSHHSSGYSTPNRGSNRPAMSGGRGGYQNSPQNNGYGGGYGGAPGGLGGTGAYNPSFGYGGYGGYGGGAPPMQSESCLVDLLSFIRSQTNVSLVTLADPYAPPPPIGMYGGYGGGGPYGGGHNTYARGGYTANNNMGRGGGYGGYGGYGGGPRGGRGGRGGGRGGY